MPKVRVWGGETAVTTCSKYLKLSSASFVVDRGWTREEPCCVRSSLCLNKYSALSSDQYLLWEDYKSKRSR